MNMPLKIGELARRTNCPVETIRYYERDGLLPTPTRSEGNYRQYDENHVERLSFIRRCRSLDMTLEEVRVLLGFLDAPDENCEAVNDLLDAHIGHVERRIEELNRLDKQLRELRRKCGASRKSKNCGILNELSHADSDGCVSKIASGCVRGAN